MPDIVDKATRSRMMSGIRGKDTKPELEVRRFLHRLGFRYRLHDKRLPGRPDIVLPKYRTVVFVHGCFWHQHPGCKYATTPDSNADFWHDKLAGNTRRDSRHISELNALGWRSITVWECEAGDLLALPDAIRAPVDRSEETE
jgi:DNA mismatch endonuclease (patch repair protein)